MCQLFAQYAPFSWVAAAYLIGLAFAAAFALGGYVRARLAYASMRRSRL